MGLPRASLQTLTERLPARDLHPTQLDLRRDRQERRHEDAGRVRESDRADLELALLLRALGVRPGRVVLLLVDAVEHVHAVCTTDSEDETESAPGRHGNEMASTYYARPPQKPSILIRVKTKEKLRPSRRPPR